MPQAQAPAPAGPGAQGRRQRLARPLGVGALALVTTVALHFRDPHTSGSWGVCPFKLLTGGLDCPGCGGLRAVNDLTNLDLAGAASSNLLFVVLIPVIVVAWVVWLRRAWIGSSPGEAPRDQPPGPHGTQTGARTGAQRRRPAWWPSGQLLGIALMVAAAVFTVARNLPAGSWLAS